MQAILHHLIYKVISLVLSITMLFGVGETALQVDQSAWNTNYSYVFVHGLSGWGSYDDVYKLMPYWGMFGGDLMEYLNNRGFHTYAASVGPTDSAWDRACELYAQLTGTVTDYGVAHSERCRHERFGKDFTGRALIPVFDETNKINLLGHSFGGATVRMFAAVMAQGSAEERAATDPAELSPYFAGGKGGWIHSVTSLAAPHNGTSAYCDDGKAEEQTPLQKALGDLMNSYNNRTFDDRIESDHANYDMYIDHALALNETMPVFADTYYFSYACAATEKQADGTYTAINSKMEFLFRSSANRIGAFTGVTDGGYVIDETWLENDGLVNTISAKAPFGQPQQDYDADHVTKGVWNIMPTILGDHMSLEGGLFHVNDIKCLYTEHLDRINRLPA